MGIEIFKPGDDGATVLRLTCDGHGRELSLIGPLTQTFQHPDGFIGQYASAMRAGWKDTFSAGARTFLGPCCSGKTPGGQESEPGVEKPRG